MRADLAEPVAVAAWDERPAMTEAYEELAAAMTLEAVAFIELAPIPAEPVTRAPAAEVMLRPAEEAAERAELAAAEAPVLEPAAPPRTADEAPLTAEETPPAVIELATEAMAEVWAAARALRPETIMTEAFILMVLRFVVGGLRR